MLRAADNSSGLSRAYIGYEFDVEQRSEIALTFSLLPQVYPTREVCVALLLSGAKPLSGLYLLPDGGLVLRGYSYRRYPGGLYPGVGIYPTGEPNFPSSTTYPSAGYPTAPSAGPHEVLSHSTGEIQARFVVTNLSSVRGEVEAYASSDTSMGSEYLTLLNWKMATPTSFYLGCVSAYDTPYDFLFTDFSIEGELFSYDWYRIADYQGLAGDGLWQGANDIFDAETYTQFTDIRNLARYDYARPEVEPATPPQGIHWRLA